MKNKLFLSGILTFLTSLTVIIIWALLRTNFNFTYPLDDSYIHLSIAKNLSNYGVWGVTKFEFASASSSPLYTLIIAFCIKVFGNSQYIPIVLNIIFGLIFIFIISKIISTEFDFIPKIFQYLLLNVFILFIPLHTIVFIAMEHTLHCLFVIMLIYNLYKYLKGDLKNSFVIPIYALLSISTRYETLFILFPIGLLLLYRKEYKLLIQIVIACSISILGFGIYFISQGGRLLPYSVLVKGQFPGFTMLGLKEYLSILPLRLYRNDASTLSFIYLFLSFIFLYIINGKKINLQLQILLVVLTTILIHLLIAGDGFFFRYQSYLITLLLFAITINYSQIANSKVLKLLLILIIMPICVYRIALSIYKTPQASMNIYEQQIYISKYLQKHQEIKKIAINDVGAMTYFNNDLQIIDTWALATRAISEFVLWEKKSGLDKKYTNKLKLDLITKLSNEKKITHAIIYPRKYESVTPNNWIVYDSLVNTKNYICGDNLVYFYKVKY